MFLSSDDEEVQPTVCQRVAERSKEAGTPLDATLYPGASHDFDDPGEKRQSVSGNVVAKVDAMMRVLKIINAAGK